MSKVTTAIQDRLRQTTVTELRFQNIVNRLLERSIICYGDTGPEDDLYNDGVKIEDLLRDYLGFMGCWLVFDYDFRFIRLYPPGADIPGDPSMYADDDQALSQKPSQIDVASILSLYMLYDADVRSGTVDEAGETGVTMEAFNIHLKKTFDKDFNTVSERNGTFAKLKKLKIVKFKTKADLTDPETWIIVRPTIAGLIHGDVVNSWSDSIDETVLTQAEENLEAEVDNVD